MAWPANTPEIGKLVGAAGQIALYELHIKTI